jgi:uncharacterized phage protein (TIGR02218 family)
MKQATTQLTAHLAGPVTTLASCWEITRRDGQIFRFTDHDRDLEIAGALYAARFGHARTAISSDASMAVDNLNVEGIIDAESLREEELRAGLFDHAEVRIFLVNWAAPGMGALRLRRGWLGEVVLTDTGQFRTELRGLTQALQQEIGELYTPECRSDLGDARCKVDLAALTVMGSVTTVQSRRVFLCTLSEPEATPEDWYTGGLLTWTSGPNAGLAIEVQRWEAGPGRITLYLPPGYPITAGDSFSLSPGCDKRFATCKAKFNNILNFRGEPYVPGLDALMSYPDAK